MSKPGDRVGAIRNADGDTVYLFGYGIYVGDEVPPNDVGGFNIGFPNPRIDLDNGKTVWGCQCWWAPEEKMKAYIDEFENVEEVSIDTE